jgi:O-antigen/teichoic acid export membrane protein
VLLYRRQVFHRFDTDVLRRLLAFSAPLVFSSVAFLLATYVDRLMVKELLGLEELGYYGLGARVASGVTLLLVGFQSALSPLIYSELDREGLHQDVARVFRLFVVVAGAALLVLVLAADLVVLVAGGPEYAPAVPVVRMLAAAALVQGSYIFFPGLYIARKTGTLALVHCGGVALNAGLNWLLIPHWGLVGSGVATLVGAITIFTLNLLLAQRYFPVPVLSRRRLVPADDAAD